MAITHAPKHTSPGVNAARIGAITVAIGIAAAAVMQFSSGDSDAPVTPVRPEIASAVQPSSNRGSLIIFVPDSSLAAELAGQFTQDEVAFPGQSVPVTYAIGSAALDERDLNEINQIRASFGAPPIMVLTVDRITPSATSASHRPLPLDEAALNELNNIRMSFGAPALTGLD